jgi:transposase
VPPKNRKNPWEYDKELYEQRNEAGRMFRWLKGFRRIATKYDKLNLMFSGFICLALCVIVVSSLIPCSVNRP